MGIKMKKFWVITLLPITVFAAAILPGGSWMQSCDTGSATYFFGVLRAKCKKSDGTMNDFTRLNYKHDCQLKSLVKNDNGILTCEQPKSQTMVINGNTNFPGGNWVGSCKSGKATLNGAMLIADCRTNQGIYKPAAIDLSHCAPGSAVNNQNGTLVCAAGTNNANDGLPGGQWRENCKLKSATLSLNVLRAECKNWSGQYFTEILFYSDCKKGSAVSSDLDRGDLKCDQKKRKW